VSGITLDTSAQLAGNQATDYTLALSPAVDTFVVAWFIVYTPNTLPSSVSITFGGVAMTAFSTVDGTDRKIWGFYIRNAAAGAKNIIATPVGGIYSAALVGASFLRAGSVGTPVTATGDSNSASSDVVSNAANLVMDCLSCGDGAALTPGAEQTVIQQGAGNGWVVSYDKGDGTITMSESWSTNSKWAHSSYEVRMKSSGQPVWF
jgi:hypothetical protein